MSIIQQPDTLSLSQNLRPFLIGAAEPVSFELKKGTVTLLSQRYEPGDNGQVEIDIRDVVHSQLSYHLLQSGGVYEQEDLASDFTAVIDGKEVNFRVVRGGVDRLADSTTNFLTQNWLTWQPTVKPVTYYSPEFLTYYAVQACTVKLKAYYSDDKTEIVSVASLNAGKAYTIPLQYATVAKLLGNKLPGYYDVWTESADGLRLTYIQRYVASPARSRNEEWILFENSLGGLDTFRAYGVNALNAKHTHNIAELDEESSEYRVDTDRLYTKNTGYLSPEESRWLLDFFPSSHKYVYTGSYLRAIVVTESQAKNEQRKEPSSYSFTYKYADARPLLNLPRTDEPTDILDIKIPELGNFTLPPRLAEVPRLPLSEGDLFPVQNPYSESWSTTTTGALATLIGQLLAATAGDGGGIGHSHKNIDLLNILSFINDYLLVDGKKINAGYADKAGAVEGMDDKFLRKDAPDTASELITFLKGLLIGKNGSGITVLEDGTSQAVVDRLYVKVKAVFDELEVKKKTHVGGEQILSPAGMKCVRVEELENAYRCYFLSELDGVTINNEFTVGSLAIAQECNIKEGTSTNAGNRYYWREVTGVGKDYIDLSKTNADKDSDIPVAGDDIVGLGHLTDIDRQSAIILSSVNETAPSITFYQGINTFSLTGKEVIGLGFDKSTGHAYINIYGDAYIGAKDKTTYIRYTQKDGVDIKGTFHIEKGSTGWKNMDGLPEEIETAADLASDALQEAESAKELADGAAKEAADAQDRMDEWADDGIISPTEKLTLKQELENLQAEYASNLADAEKYGIDGSAYTTAWNAYKAELEYHSKDTPENIEVRASFATAQKTFYTARTTLLAAIASKVKEYVDASIAGIGVGSVNLLRNSGFNGDYESEGLTSNKALTPGTELYSRALEHWSGTATVQEDAVAISGRSAILGSLSQSVSLISNETYVISYKAKGTSLSVSCGSFSVNQTLTASYQRYMHKFTFGGTGVCMLSGTATVCDVKLERGTVATDWTPSPLDSDKTAARFQSIQYIADAIKNGSVDIIGGLILANMIQLGNYKDGKMQKVTAGISGIYNDDDDVADWAGGTFEQAIRTVMLYKNNPKYQPTDAELKNMAKAVRTHGGRAILNDVILRGYIYALGGIFKGKVEIADGKTLLDDDGSGRLAGGTIYWDDYGRMFQKSRSFIVWRNMSKEMNDHKISNKYDIDLHEGTYIDVLKYFDDNRIINLPPASEVPDMLIDVRAVVIGRTADVFAIKCEADGGIKLYNPDTKTYDTVQSVILDYEPFEEYKPEDTIESIDDGTGYHWYAGRKFVTG